MEGWKKLVAGAIIGVAGTIYARDEEARRNLPRAARELPDNVRRRLKGAVSAGREASSERKREILRDLEDHGGGGLSGRPRQHGVAPEPAADEARAPETPQDSTQPIGSEEATMHGARQEGA